LSIAKCRACAGAPERALADPNLLRALRKHRLKSSDGKDVIDVLINRLQANLAPAA